mgnify:FL=1
MQRTSQKSGACCLRVSEGWDFDINNLQWKNNCLYYDGERIDDDYGASKLMNDSAILRFPSLSRMGDSAVLSMQKTLVNDIFDAFSSRFWAINPLFQFVDDWINSNRK